MKTTREMGILWCLAPLGLGLLLAGCLGGGDDVPDGPTVTVRVAALNLVGVGDVVWDVEVVNGRQGTPDAVWRERLASSRYGDGEGSVSYVGPCDATPGVHENTVRLWVVGVYADPVTDVGGFGEAPPVGPLTFENPTPYDVTTELWAAPLTHRVMCRENADSPVQFDVALMRPAGQGFFDIAVNFNDIFCSAKFDCCVENEAKTACASDIALLHDGDGERATTMVLGFACTAGPQAEVETELYLDALELDCTTPTPETFAADLVIDPSGALGNQCAVGRVGACAAATSPTTLDADAYLYQVAVYRGLELLTSEGAPGRKVYWNLALGVVRKGTEGGAVGIEDCRLRTRGTADDALGTSVVDGGVVAAGAVYPFIQWDVSLGSCQAEPLTFGDPTAMVRTAYTSTSAEEDTSFGYGFGPNLPAGSFCTPACVNGTCAGDACVCDVGWAGATCAMPLCDAGCVNGGSCTAPNTCSCAPGWEDATCTTPVCAAGCANGGSCVGPNACDCLGTGYSGPTCGTPVCNLACANGGTCTAPNTCSCASGWQGSTCATPECTPSCANGGTCTAPGVCSCVGGFSGPTCATPPLQACGGSCDDVGDCQSGLPYCANGVCRRHYGAAPVCGCASTDTFGNCVAWLSCYYC